MKRAAPDALLFATLLISLGVGCGRSEQKVELAPPTDPSQAAPAPATPDRLPPGELLEGEERAFGLALPRAVKLEATTKRVAHARGEVKSEVLADYLRKRVLAQHVEMAERKLVFPLVQLRGDPQRTMLRLEIIDEGLTTHLIVENLMGPAPIEGLSDAEHWKRAGMTPDGKLIDPQRLE